MTFVCASHPLSEATARCIRCGIHLCASCRTLDGVRNFCAACRTARAPEPPDPPAAAALAGAPVAVSVERVRSTPRPKSPWLAAALSFLPGLGQVYAGRIARGAALFGGAIALRDEPFMTPLLGAYLYVFGLFDAFRCAEATQPANAGTRSGRADDVLFLLAGLGVIAATLAGRGGFAAAPRELLLPLGGIAAALLCAHETRR